MTAAYTLSGLDGLADRIAAMPRRHPVRVAVDGRTASGKTTLANALANILRHKGRQIIRASVDGFHRPKAERYARGRFSGEGYYYDARDCDAMRRLLLDPLGPDGDGYYRIASLDLETDGPISAPAFSASQRAILIVDGTFLQRAELADAWEMVVFLNAPEAEAAARGMARDVARLGDEALVKRLYAERYRPAFALYEAACDPLNTADCVVECDAVGRAAVQFRDAGLLAEARRAAYLRASLSKSSAP